MKLKLNPIGILVLLFLSVSCSSGQVVIDVIDGDSLITSKGIEVRLSHIDAPEYNQPWGAEAKAFVKQMALNNVVKLRSMGKDKYGRTLAEVILPDGRNLNQRLIMEGLAWHYQRFSNDRFYQQLEFEARAKKKGLWSERNPIAPWNWRRGVR